MEALSSVRLIEHMGMSIRSDTAPSLIRHYLLEDLDALFTFHNVHDRE